jgi:predicted metalloendopeptidase
MENGIVTKQRLLASFFARNSTTFDWAFRYHRCHASPSAPPGPLSNFEPFHKAFGCQAGDKMVWLPADRCEIW